MSLYLPNGYINIPYLRSSGCPFIFIIGGRGIGKTYGTLQEVYDKREKFIYSLRQSNHVDLVATPEFNPWKKFNADRGLNIGAVPIPKANAYGFHEFENEKPKGPELGIAASLISLAGKRGFDGSDVKVWFVDEFIRKKTERRVKGEGTLIFDGYETINRNRELYGEQPLQAILCTNSNTLDCEILYEFELLGKIERMKRDGQSLSIMKERGICVALIPNDNPITQRKRQTALYRALGSNSSYADMALENDFAEISDQNVKSEQLIQWTPLAQIAELYVYKHKSESRYYVTLSRSGTFNSIYKLEDNDIRRFIRKYSYLYSAYMQNRVTFETSACEVIFSRYLSY